VRCPSRPSARASILVAFAILAAGCTDAPPPETSVAPVVLDLGGPWQAMPRLVDPVLLPAAIAECDANLEPNVPVGVDSIELVDARGDDRLGLFFSNGLGLAECTLTHTPPDRFEFKGGGGGQGFIPLPADGTAMTVGVSTIGTVGAGARESVSSVLGRAGAGVAGVDIVFPDSRRIRATMMNGWFTAWWPTAATDFMVQALGPDGLPIEPLH
jgi:hypothetical protein